MTKYVPGTKLIWKANGVRGRVVENYKLPGDICVEWEHGVKSSYDEWFLDEHCAIESSEVPT